MKFYPLKLLTPERCLFDGDAEALTVTCADGLLTVLAGHAPIVAALVDGPITVRTAQGSIEGTAGHGILNVGRDETVVMIRSLQRDGEAETEAAEEGEGRNELLL